MSFLNGCKGTKKMQDNIFASHPKLTQNSDVLCDSRKTLIFAADLDKGMPCESATVPAAVSPRKVCQTKPLYGSSVWEGDRLG